MIQEVFAEHAWLGQLALLVAVSAFAGVLLHLFLERRSGRWEHDAHLALDDGDTPREATK